MLNKIGAAGCLLPHQKTSLPGDDELCALRSKIDCWIQTQLARLAQPHSRRGRPPVPLEQLLRAYALQSAYRIPSRRLLVRRIDANPAFRRFVGLASDGIVWHHSVFSKNLPRLSRSGVALEEIDRIVGETAVPK